MKGFAFVLAAAVALLAAPAWAQEDGTARLREKLRRGDRVTLTLDTATVAGRVESVAADSLSVRTESGQQESVPFASVVKARRTRMGLLLGTIIGAGVGVATGAAAASYAENETGNGTTAFLFCTGVGIAAGAGIDALVNFERTVYQRPSSPRVSIVPAAGRSGGGVAAIVRW